MRAALVAALALATLSCGSRWTAVGPSDPREEHVLAETARFAAVLGVRIRGVVTEDIYAVKGSDGEPVPAAGWYESGVAYYWRPELLRRDLDFGTALAAHEVCHAISRRHDDKHAECVRRLR